MKIPAIIEIVGYEYKRQRTYDGKLKNEWRCSHNWNNVLIRNRDGLWKFIGPGPLYVNYYNQNLAWSDTPYSAYLQNLSHLEYEINQTTQKHLQLIAKARKFATSNCVPLRTHTCEHL